MAVTLGLDVGPNSIGWAIVDAEEEKIVAAGVRVFPEGVQDFGLAKEKSRNEQRRLARQMRRQHQRRGHRKQILRKVLAQAGLFPYEKEQQDALLKCDPYSLRVRALSSKHETSPAIVSISSPSSACAVRQASAASCSAGWWFATTRQPSFARRW